jgi:hypothetical protein
MMTRHAGMRMVCGNAGVSKDLCFFPNPINCGGGFVLLAVPVRALCDSFRQATKLRLVENAFEPVPERVVE